MEVKRVIPIIVAGPAFISYRSSFTGAVVGGRGYRPKRPPLEGPKLGDGVEGAEGCCGARGRLGLKGSIGAGVRLLGGAGVANWVMRPVAVAPCGPPEEGTGPLGLMTGPEFPCASE